jgi:hypothetical protein
VVITTRRRRAGSTAALLAGAALVASAALAPPAYAATPPVGLFGSSDPTYDGVFRQSLALLAYAATDTEPPAEAVTWLLDQQCADGGFQAYRADTSEPCVASDPTGGVGYGAGPETNSTGIAAAALIAVGEVAAATEALGWLEDVQKPDGGFPYYDGGDSDANSTAVALLATNAAGLDPADVDKAGASAADFLATLQTGCDSQAITFGEDGGFAFQDYGAGLVANDIASVQATLALTGRALPFTAPAASDELPQMTCPGTRTGTSVPDAAGYLGRLMDAFDGAVPTFDYGTGARVAGSVSPGDTAWAVLSLAAAGYGADQIAAGLTVLEEQTAPASAARASGGRAGAAAVSDEAPGLLGLTVLATTSQPGADSAGVAALMSRLGATLNAAPTASPSPTPTPTATPTSTPTASPTPDTGTDGDNDGGLPSTGGELADSGPTPLTPFLALAGLVLLAGGLGTVLATRDRGERA